MIDTSERPEPHQTAGLGPPWRVRLDRFDNSGFHRGRSRWVEALWLAASMLIVQSGLPGSGVRIWLLRAFGARIAPGVVIKPRVTVKFPWRLSIGAHSWIGEQVWIDNLDEVTIGAQCCISQGAYLCTGSHNWSRQSFDLILKPITVADEVWICAKASVAPGVSIGRGAVLGFGVTATVDLAPWTIKSNDGMATFKSRRVVGIEGDPE